MEITMFSNEPHQLSGHQHQDKLRVVFDFRRLYNDDIQWLRAAIDHLHSCSEQKSSNIGAVFVCAACVKKKILPFRLHIAHSLIH